MKKVIVIILIIVILIVGFALAGINRLVDELEGSIGFVPPLKFGGIELINANFDTIDSTVSKNGSNTSILHYLRNGDGDLEVVADTVENEYHANLRIDTSIDNYDVFMIDFDLEIVKLNDTLNLYGVHRNSSGDVVGAASGCSQYLKINSVDGILEYHALIDGIWDLVGSSDTEAHFTILYRYNRENYRYSDAIIYIDGEYLCSIDGFIRSNVVKLSSLRFHQLASDNNDSPDTFCIDNFSVYGFALGYEGSIIDVIEDPSISLKDCVDSVLYRS